MEAMMSGGIMLVAFSSLSFAASFLALIMVMTDSSPQKIAEAMSGMTPGARRQAQFEQLDEMTRIADAAIEARRLGKRFTRADAGL
jgi:hypothetical protein